MRRKITIKIGDTFGRLTVTKYAGKRGRYHHWHCQCACGTPKTVEANNLASGNSKSCGCYKSERTSKRTRATRKLFIEPGQVFHRWTVVEPASKRNYFTCKCQCGTVATIYEHSLARDLSRSCGCLKNEELVLRRRSHGDTESKEYSAWCKAKSRCYNKKNPKYRIYGGRGITMCDAWLNDYSRFLSDMGRSPKGLTLDREDVNGPYSKKNCRWATAEQQANNQRHTRLYQWHDEMLSIPQIARKIGIGGENLRRRVIDDGQSVHAAAAVMLENKVRKQMGLKRRHQVRSGCLNHSGR